MNHIPSLACAPLLAVLLAGCQPAAKSTSASPAPGPPAKVATENDLATIALKPEAEKRLGITTIAVEKRRVARKKNLGGELLLPLGRAAGAKTNEKTIYALLPSM